MAQSLVILDKITSLDSYKKLYETNTLDHNNSYFKSNDKGQWNNIPLEDVYFYEDHLICSIDTSVKNTTIKLIDYLEKTYPNNLTVEEMYYDVKGSFSHGIAVVYLNDVLGLINLKNEKVSKFMDRNYFGSSSFGKRTIGLSDGTYNHKGEKEED